MFAVTWNLCFRCCDAEAGNGHSVGPGSSCTLYAEAVGLVVLCWVIASREAVVST